MKEKKGTDWGFCGSIWLRSVGGYRNCRLDALLIAVFMQFWAFIFSPSRLLYFLLFHMFHFLMAKARNRDFSVPSEEKKIHLIRLVHAMMTALCCRKHLFTLDRTGWWFAMASVTNRHVGGESIDRQVQASAPLYTIRNQRKNIGWVVFSRLYTHTHTKVCK